MSFSDFSISVIAGLNGAGKTLLLQSIHRLTECIRNCYSANDLSVIEFKQWISLTPIKLLEIDFSNIFLVEEYEGSFDSNSGLYFKEKFLEQKIKDGTFFEEDEWLSGFGMHEYYDKSYEFTDVIWLNAREKTTIFLDNGEEKEGVVNISYNFKIELYSEHEIEIHDLGDLGHPELTEWRGSNVTLLHRFNFDKKNKTNLDGGSYPLSSAPSFHKISPEGWQQNRNTGQSEINPLYLGESEDWKDWIVDELNDKIKLDDLLNFPSSTEDCRSPISYFIDTNRLIDYNTPDFLQASIPIFINNNLEKLLMKDISLLRERLFAHNLPLSHRSGRAESFHGITRSSELIQREDLMGMMKGVLSDDDFKAWRIICNNKEIKNRMQYLMEEYSRTSMEDEIIRMKKAQEENRPMPPPLWNEEKIKQYNSDRDLRKIMIMRISISILQQQFGATFFLSEMIPKELKLPFNKTHYSSGEQQMRTILYQLMDSTGSSILLIDEPEISLHLEWQRSLIDNISKFRNRSIIEGWIVPQNFRIPKSIIISTHSPDIIYHHPELVMSIPPDTEG